MGPGTATTPPWRASSSSELQAPDPAPSLPPDPAPSPPPAVPDRRRLRLLVAYAGTTFRGFALQPGVPTVADALAGALERVLRHPVELTCAGRTDAGVHAWGQVVTLDASAAADLERLQRSVNKMLAPHVAVRQADWAPPGFDARRSALSRTYRYTLLCGKWPDPFLAATVWHVGTALDVRGMQAASDPLLGEHDFSSFCHAPRGRPGPLVRRVLRAEWSELGRDLLQFEIEASSFCHQMVRSVVGTLVDVGLGRRQAGQMMSVLLARDRAAAGPLAPPTGLCLWEVTYPATASGAQLSLKPGA